MDWDLIGHGGFGDVYSAHDLVHDRDVAVKVMRAPLDAHASRLFEREVKVAGRLSSHPNIVPIYASGISPAGIGWLAMELEGRGSLVEIVDQDGPFEPDLTARLVRDVANALDALHEQGIVHCDVKPGNVFLSDYGSAKLADFGIARLTLANQRSTLDDGAGPRSPAYASPEVLLAERVTAATDTWMLAATACHLLTGVAPFGGEQIATAQPGIDRVATELADLPTADRLRTLLMRAFDARPSGRPPSCGAFAAAFAEALEVEGPGPSAPPRLGSSRRPESSTGGKTFKTRGGLLINPRVNVRPGKVVEVEKWDTTQSSSSTVVQGGGGSIVAGSGRVDPVFARSVSQKWSTRNSRVVVDVEGEIVVIARGFDMPVAEGDFVSLASCDLGQGSKPIAIRNDLTRESIWLSSSHDAIANAGLHRKNWNAQLLGLVTLVAIAAAGGYLFWTEIAGSFRTGITKARSAGDPAREANLHSTLGVFRWLVILYAAFIIATTFYCAIRLGRPSRMKDRSLSGWNLRALDRTIVANVNAAMRS